MPPKIGFKQAFPCSTRKLRPLSERTSSVEKTIDFVEDLINFESEEVLRSSSSDQDSVSSKSPPSSPRTLNTSDQEDNMDPPPPPIDEIDPMMRPQELPIVVPPNLREIPIPTHLPKFSGSPHEDTTAHVERFEKLLVSSLVTNYSLAITAVLEVEVIEEEQERMEKQMEEPIPSFIPISHHSNETTRLEMKEHYLMNTNSVSFIQPVPLATREPPPLLPNMEQLQLVV